jgi:hypothetical protein
MEYRIFRVLVTTTNRRKNLYMKVMETRYIMKYRINQYTSAAMLEPIRSHIILREKSGYGAATQLYSSRY